MRIVLFLVLAVVVLIVLAISSQRLNWRSKLSILAVCVVLFVTGFLYNVDDERRSNDIQVLLTEFNTKDSINCGDLNISKKSYNYEFGTQSFVAKDKSGIIIPIQKCLKEN
ncbi:MAG: hypothetical protein J6V67_03740 [Campylobacter sp.]|uniref:hypothetical protein n=1 Tax=Campylobacter sp. TaxID=205 RepID=UPI001B214EFD|nr:hypothetical protein [Campylobacter sp.]MBO7154983.1 hypothetical protein [Campylobacter sp.]